MDQDNELPEFSVGFIRKLARNLVKKCKIISPPIKISDIFKVVDKKIEVKGIDLGTDDGFSVGGSIINYNSTSSVLRQRFTVAHELGHILLGHNSSFRNININSTETNEKSANIFAAELLVPLPIVKKENLILESLTSISSKYQVSKDMMLWSLKNLHLDLKLGNWK